MTTETKQKIREHGKTSLLYIVLPALIAALVALGSTALSGAYSAGEITTQVKNNTTAIKALGEADKQFQAVDDLMKNRLSEQEKQNAVLAEQLKALNQNIRDLKEYLKEQKSK